MNRLQQPIKQYKILLETHPSGLITNRMKTLCFTGTKGEAVAHLQQYITTRNLHAYKVYIQEVV